MLKNSFNMFHSMLSAAAYSRLIGAICLCLLLWLVVFWIL